MAISRFGSSATTVWEGADTAPALMDCGREDNHMLGKSGASVFAVFGLIKARGPPRKAGRSLEKVPAASRVSLAIRRYRSTGRGDGAGGATASF